MTRRIGKFVALPHCRVHGARFIGYICDSIGKKMEVNASQNREAIRLQTCKALGERSDGGR
jgi:hypothetical protein